MKKTIAILLVAVMALTLFAACGSKKGSDALIGTWAHEESEDGMTAKMTFEFKENGKLIIKGYLNDAEITSQEVEYTVEDGKIIVDGDPEPYSISGNKLTLGEGEDAMVLTKE